MVSKYSIKDLEMLSGIKAHTLRAWEQRYKVIEPKRTETNIRYYNDDDLRKLLNISYLVHNGVKISKVACLSKDEMCKMVRQQSLNQSEYKAEINAMKMAMMNFDSQEFLAAYNQAEQQYDEETLMTKVMSEFLKEIGILWQSEVISMPHEHFVSNLMKQKLYASIERYSQKTKSNAKTYLLFLPANELHEIGLLFLQFKLLKRGERVIFLGANTPHDYLMNVYNKVSFDFLVSIFTTSPNHADVESYVSSLEDMFAETSVKILLTGTQLSNSLENSSFSSRVKLYRNVAQLSESL